MEKVNFAANIIYEGTLVTIIGYENKKQYQYSDSRILSMFMFDIARGYEDQTQYQQIMYPYLSIFFNQDCAFDLSLNCLKH